MKKIDFNYDEIVNYYKLPNGLRVYLYKTNKTKNFYVTVSTRFGADVMKYKKGNKTYEVTKGSAHFLEHRVMDFSKNKDAADKISEFGSMANAYTTYNGTNYNIFGHENIIENIELLFDRVFKADIKDEDVENERGIILEEYDMYFDDPYFILHNNLSENIFTDSSKRFPVLGTRDGIKSVCGNELRRLYRDFYRIDNMFVIVSGDFNEEEVISFITNYTKDIKVTSDKPKVIKAREKEIVITPYEEISMPVNESKVIVGYKSKMLKDMLDVKQKSILSMVLGNVFGLSGEAYEELNKKGIKRFNWGFENSDGYFLIYFKASTNEIDVFLEIIDKYINKLNMDEEALERKKRARLSTLILSFENILDVEDRIASEVFTYNKVINDRDNIIKSITFSEVNKLLKSINLESKSVLKIKGE